MTWMKNHLSSDGCVYQDDVVDYIVKNGCEELLTENAEGNLVLGKKVLNAFMKETKDDVVWVHKDFYWRHRTTEDEDGRNASG
ncbi:DUF6953 family protein [Serratia fonticola]|uniref:DUF6953 family protein n=1 Tax=Serratia fonticola TaxID=47917 RepID=UPI003AAD3BBF